MAERVGSNRTSYAGRHNMRARAAKDSALTDDDGRQRGAAADDDAHDGPGAQAVAAAAAGVGSGGGPLEVWRKDDLALAIEIDLGGRAGHCGEEGAAE